MTFGGECLSLAAAISTINELRKKDYAHIWKMGQLFKEGIDKAAKSAGLEINLAGSAPRHNLTFSSDYADPTGMKDLFYQEMVKKDILFTNVLYKSFAHTEEDIQKTSAAAEVAFEKVRNNIDNIDNVLEGKRSVSIFRKNT